MVVKLTTDVEERVKEFNSLLGAVTTANERFAERLLLAVDAGITAYIEARFERGADWESLSEGTMALRQLAKGGQSGVGFHSSNLIRRRSGTRRNQASPIGGGISGEASSIGFRDSKLKRTRKNSTKVNKATRRLYYFKQNPSIGDPFSSRGFGWTGRVRKVALTPGKVRVGKRRSSYRRTFKGRSSVVNKLLRYWHFGVTQTITSKQRNFLMAAGLALGPKKTKLVRPPRPIHKREDIEQITELRVAEFETDFARIFGRLFGQRFSITN